MADKIKNTRLFPFVGIKPMMFSWCLVTLIVYHIITGCIGGRLPNCPYPGLLVLRPNEPFAFVGETKRLCCKAIDLAAGGETLAWPSNVNLLFSCSNINGGAVIDPLQNTLTSDSVCANVTATSLNPDGVCACQVEDRPDCTAGQFISVDEPLPTSIDISCITYGRENVTCSPTLPRFAHPERATTTISWRQITGFFNIRNNQQRSKVCSSYNTCTLTAFDGVMFGLSLTFNISISVDYATEDGQSRVSRWMVYDISSHVKLKPLRASVAGVTDTGVVIAWKRQNSAYPGNKIVRVSYRQSMIQNLEERSDHRYDVIETTQFGIPLVESAIQDLEPSTTYSVALTTKPEQSETWSDPVFLTASTLPTS